MSIRTALAMAALAATAVALAPRIATADCADLALVLAIDSSGSVDAAEDSLQRTGYAAAFSDPTVQAALQAAGVVDVALVLWGDTEMSPQVFPWQRIAGPADVPAVATTLLQAPRRVTGNTGIGSGVMAALDLLSAHCGLRQVINVSGDGIESQSPTARRHVTLVAARARAVEMGVTINALAITDDTADLAQWYEKHLITGAGSFVIEVNSFAAFGEAIIRKLGREITPPQLALLQPAD